jgi:hypothetical protein
VAVATILTRSSWLYTLGRPDRCSSSRPARPRSAKRQRHTPTNSSLIPTFLAI